MIFLPASFIAAVFGMNVREINTGGTETIANYAAVSVAFTVLTAWLVISFQSHSPFHETGAGFGRRLAWPYFYVTRGTGFRQALRGEPVGSANGPCGTSQPKVAPVGSEVLTVGVIGDYGWTGWTQSSPHFCLEVLPELQAAGLTIPNEVLNDYDPGDITYINNATALQTIPYKVDTSSYIGQVCIMKNCAAFVSVCDNFYDSGIDFTTGGIQRFQEAWVGMYSQGNFESTPWYQCLGNHDIVKGQSGVDFQTRVTPVYHAGTLEPKGFHTGLTT
ncbi:hypothetical protein AZE42_07805 [Rhizopogon vesiculosus]|uniref:Calcineurin-like phosphoesterase domain-containing protein n=1 Tax=Rhizopogon vesiculosus TaxID=180088 RepID=A0A1J8Q1Q5_9AGAM|nr:hypothetical protein AZE42_07805 [Rhizopogon vesiculosus]